MKTLKFELKRFVEKLPKSLTIEIDFKAIAFPISLDIYPAVYRLRILFIEINFWKRSFINNATSLNKDGEILTSMMIETCFDFEKIVMKQLKRKYKLFDEIGHMSYGGKIYDDCIVLDFSLYVDQDNFKDDKMIQAEIKKRKQEWTDKLSYMETVPLWRKVFVKNWHTQSN